MRKYYANQIITQLLKDRRQELKISQTKLATACGLASKSQISKLEAGKLIWTFANILAACELLGLELVIREKSE
jgi:transcriptional regulator with XRE-family HTH domain